MDNQSIQPQNVQKQTRVKILQWIYLISGGLGLLGFVSTISLFFRQQLGMSYITSYLSSPLFLFLDFVTIVSALTIGVGLLRYTRNSLILAERAGYVLLPTLIINAIRSLSGFIGFFGQFTGTQTTAKTAVFSIFGFYEVIFLVIQLAVVIFTIKTVRKILKTVSY